MIALDAALRRLTVCQLTRESRGNGGGLRPRVWLRLRAAAGATGPRMNLTIGRRSQFLLVLGHEAHPKTTLYGVVFQKIEWAPAYGQPGGVPRYPGYRPAHLLENSGFVVCCAGAAREAGQLERIEHIEKEISELNEGKKEIYQEAKSNGFDPKVVREIVRLRKQDQKEREEHESLLEVYLRAIDGARVSKAA